MIKTGLIVDRDKPNIYGLARLRLTPISIYMPATRKDKFSSGRTKCRCPMHVNTDMVEQSKTGGLGNL